MIDLKTAIVTGAARGIGRSIALRLASDGMNVVVNDIEANTQALQELATEIANSQAAKGSSANAHVVTGDVSVSSDVQNLIKETVSKFGSLDVMVANAGILMMSRIEEVDEDEWDKLISVNIRGTMLCFKYAAQQMISQGKGGCMLAASSIAGRRGHAGGCAYSTSKFAIRGLVQSSAVDLGKYQIRVNAYAPGFIDTDMSRKALDYAKADYEAAAKAASPLGRVGETTDISNLASFLVSSESSFITGQTYGACGGFYLD
ncbi:short chain oxidoreductase [Schizopora paradoxa]|uniref:Short chain oxidoreductase n=1 Tax=Schizopora paradoxa TaxID=27342 RepID=A0A0H2RL22_9AGAM|nr:short chain oxidoreductase [Schizopora paradoxa]